MDYNIELLKTKLLLDFPSGSSLNYQDETLYLVGDDANALLILDKDYLQQTSVQLFNYPEKRIPKPIKPDLEASVFITIADHSFLLIVGSASRPHREQVILIPFTHSRLDKDQIRIISTETFTNRLRLLGIPEVNLEGATAIGEMLLLSNRGNWKNDTNHIILTTTDFWERQDEAELAVIPVNIISASDAIIGISELCYEKQIDTLFISFSSEHTENAYDDGTIGDSYLGWIDNVSQKLKTNSLSVDRIMNLSDAHIDLKKEKIEGLCVESVNENEILLHLVSDNDKGQSKLFKLRLTILM